MSVEQTIYTTAVNDGMPQLLAKFIVAQSKHETGNYKHRFFTVGNNAFGYAYVPGAKWQLDKGGPVADNGIPIAQYATIQNSVHELTDWIKRRKSEGRFPDNLSSISTPDQYAMLLKQAGYYTDTFQNYATAVNYWYNRLPVMAATGGALILVAALLLIFKKDLGL